MHFGAKEVANLPAEVLQVLKTWTEDIFHPRFSALIQRRSHHHFIKFGSAATLIQEVQFHSRLSA